MSGLCSAFATHLTTSSWSFVVDPPSEEGPMDNPGLHGADGRQSMPFDTPSPTIPAVYVPYSHPQSVRDSIFGENDRPPPIPASFSGKSMMMSDMIDHQEDVAVKTETIGMTPETAPLITSNIMFSKFVRASQIDRLLTELMNDAIQNSLEWKSNSARRQKAKRIRRPSIKADPIVSVKKFKITVKKSVLKDRSVSDNKVCKTETQVANPVANLLTAQQSEKAVRDLARKNLFLELYDKLKKRDKYKFFHHPVDTKLVPDYLEVIAQPMDFSTIHRNILRSRYQNLNAIRSDIDLIFHNCMRYNHPLTVFYQQAESMLNYVDRMITDAKRVFEPEEIPPLIHPYETLEMSVMAVDDEILLKKLSTDKIGSCDGLHCSTLEDIGAFDVNKGRFESCAPDRANSVECGSGCACAPESCLNRGVSEHRGKRIGVDIDKRSVFGIDAHTHSLIRKALSATSATPEELSSFIETKVLRYINMHIPSDEKGDRRKLHMMCSMKALAADSSKVGDTTTQNRAQSLIHDLKAGLSLPVYDKGHGVVCINPVGFKKNEFIVEYVGEVYPPWRWFEKQAVLKQFQKVYMMPFSFGFYNILLERHKDDLQGYDVLYVDACRKGNFASRLSHSCSPNCTSVVIASGGRFAIVVLALRDIAPNEELTFDYHSVTESPDEAKNALCFCGWSICRGRYVHFAGPDTFQHVLNVHHGFAHRTALLLRACSEPLNAQDRSRLSTWRLLGSVLDGLPEWAVKYAALIVEYIEFEKATLPNELMQLSKFNYTREAAEFDTLGVTESRIQCLAVCLDKVKYVLREAGGVNEPPLRLLSNEEVIDRVWNSDDSIISSAAKKIRPLLDDVDLIRLAECTSSKVTSRREMVSSLIDFRDLLRSMPPSASCFHHVAADIVHMYAYTDTFYCMINYPIVKSPSVHFSELGLNITNPDDEALLTPKPYTQAFIWGALMLWFKQSLDRPDAAAHNAKRGTVCLPSLEGCYTSSIRNELVEVYTPAQRESMIACLQAVPAVPIPRHAIWDYRSTNDRVYGSPMLDSIYKKKDTKPLIKGLLAWQPPTDAEGAFTIVQSPKRRQRRARD